MVQGVKKLLLTTDFYVLNLSGFIKLSLHRRVVTSQLLDGKSLCLVIGKTQVVLRTDESILNLLKVLDGLVDFIDGSLELLACKAIVLAKLILKIKQLILKVGYIAAFLRSVIIGMKN